MDQEFQQLVTSFRRILDHYAIDYKTSPMSYNNDTLYDHQCRLIIEEIGRYWLSHYGHKPSAATLQKALFAAEQSRRFSPPWYRRLLRRWR
ncbi:hypothetical protein [Zobellella maritima]|uniref:hypothetical protein n=1 Tax=Zobellella maritima TaxID=2059725 RepID=UPI000E301814|nr:hypothetical protein [Zobellella maritima]